MFPLYLVILSAFSSSGSLQVTSFIPTEFSIKSLTKSAKEILTTKYQNYDWPEIRNILDSINSYPDNNGKEFVDKTRYFDNIRNENFSKTHPEIAKAMGYVYNNNL